MWFFREIRFWFWELDSEDLDLFWSVNSDKGSEFTVLYGIFQWFQIMSQNLLIQKPVWTSLNQFDSGGKISSQNFLIIFHNFNFLTCLSL